jgi:ParB family chromosome partitioning protein
MFGAALNRAGTDAMFGLSSGFPSVLEVEIERVVPNPDQPRRHFDEAALAELAASIERHGLLQPITVKKHHDGGYLLVAGERRWRALKSLGRPTVFAILTEGDPAELALIENLQRQDLNAVEEAEAFQRLIDRHNYTQDQLGQIVGRHQSAVAHTLRLLCLHETVRAEYATSHNQVARSMLLELSAVQPTERQLELWQRIKDGGLTVQGFRKLRRDDRPAAEKKTVRAEDGTDLGQTLNTVRLVTRDLSRFRRQPRILDPQQRRDLHTLRTLIDHLLANSPED